MWSVRMNSSGLDGPNWSYVQSGLKLPNCTTYCRGEMAEQAGEFQAVFNGYSQKGFPNAKYWYSTWKGSKGAEPKPGGILVWNGNLGHVAYVISSKAIAANKWSVQVSQSNYGGAYFELKTYEVEVGKATVGVGLPYIGCCYCKIDDKRVARDTSKNQIIISYDLMRLRKSPDGEIKEGLYAPVGIYNVLKKEGNWVQLDTNDWVGLSPGNCDYYPSGDDPEIEVLKNKLQENQKAFNNIKELCNKQI